ncbi:meteorin-like [Littorina saxatilis]|uniref:meteorin-like n=1 Tax=Littorina saxatilis TaxID=31220 RepID=UPI0038B462D3
MASQVVLIGAFVACVLCCGVLGSGWGDPCTVIPGGNSLTESGGEVTAPSNCTEGSVWWNYPRGTLQVNFHTDQNRPFTVCLTPSLGPLLNSVAQLYGGHRFAVRSPSEGETVCLPRADTTVTAMLEQPNFQTYMTLYDFTLSFSN